MSSFNIADYLATDDLTVLLGLIGATLFLLNNLYKPQPLVHPILLGRQSDVARVRNPGESAVYRNYSTGLMGRFPVRPSKETHILADLVRPEGEASRTLWSTKITNNQLQDRAAAFGTGLLRLAGLKPNQSDVLLLLNGGIEFLISDLALASHSILSYTLDSSDLLSPWLDARRPSAIITHVDLLPQILELIYESGVKDGYTVVVVGEPSPQTLASVASQIKLLRFSEVEREGFRVEKILSTLPKESDVFTVHFARHTNEAILGTQLTHENLTAGVAAIRLLLPAQQLASSLDTVVSAHPVSAPFGRSVLYTAVFEGTSFATLDSAKVFVTDTDSTGTENVDDVLSSKNCPIPSPTILFLKSGHLVALAQAIKKASEEALLLSSVAWRHKVAGVREGFLTKESLWDRLVFDGARAKILGEIAGTLRVAIISNGGSVPVEAMADARIVLSVPLINTYVHPISAGPILASHPYDFQHFPPEQGKDASLFAHQGPPSVNVEVKLAGVSDDHVEQGQNPEGVLCVRGPPVGKILGIEDYVSIPTPQENDGWLSTGARGEVRSNGSFVITL